jgi:hypothetical protein
MGKHMQDVIDGLNASEKVNVTLVEVLKNMKNLGKEKLRILNPLDGSGLNVLH